MNEAVDNMGDSLLTLKDVDNEINELLNISLSRTSDNNSISTALNVAYPDQDYDINEDIITLYKNATGNSDTAGMTQKAIKELVNTTKLELQQLIENSSGGSSGGSSEGGTTNLGPGNAGLVVVVDENGNIIAGSVLETSIIEALIKTDTYSLNDATGVSFDYENRIYEKTQEGSSFNVNYNNFPMFGGRMRCNVDDNGQIIAWYGDSNYAEDGSNGQVMVYQPKFYYQRLPISTRNLQTGKVIRKESLILSPTEQTSFKLHPMFINESGEEVDYVLFSAYEGCAQKAATNEYVLDDNAQLNFDTDKLSSIAGAKPVSGAKNALNFANAEKLAKNRGNGWHITNLAFESVN